MCGIAVSLLSKSVAQDQGLDMSRAEILEVGRNHLIYRMPTDPGDPVDESLAFNDPIDSKDDFQVDDPSRSSHIVQLASGLHYKEKEQWFQTQEVFEISKNKKFAQVFTGPHKVILSANINTPGGVELMGEEGTRMRSYVFCLAYQDSQSGQTVMIGELKDSAARIIAPNQVIYENAFTDIKADVRYTYRCGGFEQDVILREAPPSPEEYGLDPQETLIQVWTEFIEAPGPRKRKVPVKEAQPGKRQRMRFPDVFDEELDFGDIKIGWGKAFGIELADKAENLELVVSKEWGVAPDDRLYLIESIDYQEALVVLGQLPQAAVEGKKSIYQSPEMMAQVRSRSTTGDGLREVASVQNDSPMLVAYGTASQDPGFVIDYVTESGSDTNYVFRGDQTYYISGPYTLYGNTVFEGGAVIKFASSAYLNIQGTIDCQTDFHRPVYFTSWRDGTIGEYVSSGPAYPADYPYAIRLNNGGTYVIRNARFRYANDAIHSIYSGTASVIPEIWHSQFVNCYDIYDCYKNGTLKLRNTLLKGFTYAARQNYGLVFMEGENVTMDSGSGIGNSTLYSVTMKNSILTSVGSTRGIDSSISTQWLSSSTGVYETVGAGRFYLDGGSPYRNIGTDAISSELKEDLTHLTTYPPVIYEASETLYEDAFWGPVAERDTELVDLGYHYPPIDYLLYSLYLADGIDLTIGQGTVVASYGTEGLRPRSSNEIYIDGKARDKVIFCRYEVAQDNTVRLGAGSLTGNSYYYQIFPASVLQNRVLKALGTQFIAIGSSVYQRPIYFSSSAITSISQLVLMDCEFFNGLFFVSGSDEQNHSVINSLFYRGEPHFYYSADLMIHNCHFGNSTVRFFQQSAAEWTIRDNLFSGSTFPTSSWAGNLTYGYNGYLNNGSSRVGATTLSSDVVLNGNYPFVKGPMGDFYQNSSLYASMINKGSRTASHAELFHFTSSVFQTKDAGQVDQVDIGLHYPATDSNNNPIDTDGDGISDYMEDGYDGDGNHDSGVETNWNLSENSPTGTGTYLVVYTPFE